MKNECSIVRDLLPLYAEGMLSEDSAAISVFPSSESSPIRCSRSAAPSSKGFCGRTVL